MSELRLEALRGDDALGFLAALGTQRLVSEVIGIDSRLGWPRGPRGTATIDLPDGWDLAGLADRLRSVAAGMLEAGMLVPRVRGFPPAKQGTGGSDPLRSLHFEDGVGLAATARDGELAGENAFAQWLRSVVSVGALRDTGRGESLATSAFLVWPTGQFTFDRALRDACKSGARLGVLEAALSRWRRTDATGAYLDHRAIRDAYIGQHTKGQMPNHGEPGATWLALMAMPWFPVVATERGPVTTGWFPRRRGKRPGFFWPVWTPTLDSAAIRVLLSHPAVRKVVAGEDRGADRLPSVVAAVFAASRLPGPKNVDGPIGPAVARWEHAGAYVRG